MRIILHIIIVIIVVVVVLIVNVNGGGGGGWDTSLVFCISLSYLFSCGRIDFATVLHDSTHARLVFLICARNSGQSCLSWPMWISMSRNDATCVLISISNCNRQWNFFFYSKYPRKNIPWTHVWQIWLINFHCVWIMLWVDVKSCLQLECLNLDITFNSRLS